MHTAGVREKRFCCPWCGERISMLLDLSAGGQDYIEDCEVCCAPIIVRFEVEEGRLRGFCAERA
jgi:transcription elongation factor Elf1